MEELVETPKRKRGTYRRPGHKEVTTRMPVELASAVRAAAAREGISINDYMIRVVDEAVRDGHDLKTGALRVEMRRALQTALAQLDGLNEEELPTAV